MQNRNNFPSSHSYEHDVFENKRQIKNIQTSYFINQYDRNIQDKVKKMQHEKQQKKKELEMYNSLNFDYMRDLNKQKYRLNAQKNYLAKQYDSMIENNMNNSRMNKSIEKGLEMETIYAPNWLRDTPYEREIQKQKCKQWIQIREIYSKQLEDHMKQQKYNNNFERRNQLNLKKKLQVQASSLLQKEYQELEARHKRKSMFEKRQNQLLGLNEIENIQDQSNNMIDKENQLRKKESKIYSKGLEIQYQKQMNAKRRQVQVLPEVHTYNPITNPIPYTYKNPYVLKMLSGQ